MGKKLGLGWSRALPVMRQKDDILIQKFTVAGVDIVCQCVRCSSWCHTVPVPCRLGQRTLSTAASPHPPLSPLPGSGSGSGAAEIKMTPICAAAARLRSMNGRESI